MVYTCVILTIFLHYVILTATMVKSSYRIHLLCCFLIWQPLVVLCNSNGWSCEQLDYCDDKFGFEAIRWLHRQLDDDANGNVDIAESDEFLRDELKYENGHDRHKAFHGNDKHISVDELWRSWRVSEVHNWTKEETAEWLVNSVELPQYAELFLNNNVDGTKLPRLASNTQQLTISLGIKDPVHRQKIALKAMDVVLFGPPKQHNFVKDCVLAFSLLIAVVGCWFAFFQHKRSQAHLKKMLRDMDSLQKAEEQLMQLQNELDKAQQEQRKMVSEKQTLEEKLKASETAKVYSDQNKLGSHLRDSSLPNVNEFNKVLELEEELKETKELLLRAESALSSKSWVPPQRLQHWLRTTYDKESKHFEIKRKAATFQLESAKKACEKLNKTRSSFLGSFRVAHGSVIDDVDSRILQAKASLAEVTSEIQERAFRWREIEQLCGFSIVSWSSVSRDGSQAALARNNSDSTLRDSAEGSDFGSSQNYGAGSQNSVPVSIITRLPDAGSRISLPTASISTHRKSQLSNSFNAGHPSESEYNENESEESDDTRATFTLGDTVVEPDSRQSALNRPLIKSTKVPNDYQANAVNLSSETDRMGKSLLSKPVSCKDLSSHDKAHMERSSSDSPTPPQNRILTKAKRVSELGQSCGGDTDESVDTLDNCEVESTSSDSVVFHSKKGLNSSSSSEVTIKAHNSEKKKKVFGLSLLRRRKPNGNHD